MTFTAVYHPAILDDLSDINRNLQTRIEHAITERLCIAPQAYSKPLAANLAGYWKMRVGDYRVVFKIVKQEIWIYAIINRRDIYSDVIQRSDWKP